MFKISTHPALSVLWNGSQIRRGFIFLLLTLALGGTGQKMTAGIVNFAHLDHLNELITLDGKSMLITHIYSQAPTYRWASAKGEGVACLDDTARAAVLFLRKYELTGEIPSLKKAHLLLNFVMHMQAEDGEFYNFILADHSINRRGKTSKKSFTFWAARGLWALGYGTKVFKPIDPQFAGRLSRHFNRSMPRVDDLLKRYGLYEEDGPSRYPTWLIAKYAADATSEMLLGMAEYYRVNPSRAMEQRLRRLADGLVAMQVGRPDRFPYAALLCWKGRWHAWGSSQLQALAIIGALLGEQRFIQAAERQACGLYEHILTVGYIKGFSLSDGRAVTGFEQTAYGLRPMVVGLIRLSEATGKHRYREMAERFAQWFLGKNAANVPMYASATGRCFDGILSPRRVNRNAGAESTIEALYALLELGASRR